MIARRSLGVALVAAALALGGPAFASHYFLADIDLVTGDARTRLEADGIKSTDQLLDRVARKADRAALAKKTGVDAAVLDAVARQVDMLRVRGIGPKMVRLLEAAGVHTVAELRTQAADPLFARVVQVNDERHLSEIVPDASILLGWIDQAKTLPLVLED